MAGSKDVATQGRNQITRVGRWLDFKKYQLLNRPNEAEARLQKMYRRRGQNPVQFRD